MKRVIAFLLFLLMLVVPPLSAYNEAGPENLATPTDLQPVYYDYLVSRNNMPLYSIVAFNNATINGHIRGSIFVGGTLTGSQYVDDGSLNKIAASDSYVRNNESQVYFRGRTEEQSLYAYRALNETSGGNTAAYWRNFIEGLPTTGTYVYLQPDESGTVTFGDYEYQANGSDEAYRTIDKIYWTDATTVNMAGMAGHLIAPYATVNVTWCNFCGSIVAVNVYCNGEAHINTYVPPIIEPEPSPTPTPTPITITKQLNGEIWSLRCDTMDNTNFKAGGGYWMADINNPTHNTSKEGHRSNHCGNRENWVLFVNEEGQAISLYQLKSGSTGGTLPSIVYRAPADLCSIPEGQFIYDPTNPDDVMTKRLIEEVFIPQNAMPFEEINLVEGQRLFWISQNGKQVWHHTGVLKKTTPRFAFIINGEPYTLGVGETITLTEVEEGLLEIEEIATSNYKMVEITNDGEGNYVVINEIDPPDKPTPTPPPPVVTPTPTPSPTPEETESPSPTPEETETPSPTPEETESPSPTPEETETPSSTPEETETPSPTPEITDEPSPSPDPTCGFTIKKIVSNYELMDSNAIFFFQIHSANFEEDEYIEITVDCTTGIGEWSIDGLKPGKYSITEIDIPSEFELTSDETITLYVHESEEFEFINKVKEPEPSESPSPEPSEEPSPSPEPSEEPSPSPEPSEEPSPEPSEEPSPSPEPSEEPSPSPEPSEEPSPEPSEEPSPSPESSEKPSPEPSEEPSPSPEPSEEPSPSPEISESPEPSEEPTSTPSEEPSPEPNEEPSEKPSESPTSSPTPTVPPTTVTPSEVPSETPTSTPSPTPSPTVTTSPIPSEIPEESESPSPSPTPEESETPFPTPSPTPEETESPTPPPTTVTPSEVPSESPTPSPTLSPTPTITTSPIPSEEPTPSEEPEPSEEPTEEPTPSEEPTSTPLPTLPPEPLPEVTPEPIPWEGEEEVELITIGVRKRWNDEGYNGVRPALAYVKLYADEIYIKKVELNNENEWFVILEVPKYNDEGNEIIYEWKEVEVPGYHIESTYEIDAVTTITNRIYEIPQIPKGMPKPTLPKKTVVFTDIDEYETALGINITINHVGDCFD